MEFDRNWRRGRIEPSNGFETGVLETLNLIECRVEELERDARLARKLWFEWSEMLKEYKLRPEQHRDILAFNVRVRKELLRIMRRVACESRPVVMLPTFSAN